MHCSDVVLLPLWCWLGWDMVVWPRAAVLGADLLWCCRQGCGEWRGVRKQRREVSSTCRVRGLGGGSGEKEVMCEVLGIHTSPCSEVPVTDLPTFCFSAHQCLALSSSRLRLPRRRTQRRVSRGVQRLSVHGHGVPCAQGSEALTLSLSHALALSRTNLSAPLLQPLS